MKLAMIRRRFSATGGAELYLQRLMSALSQAGHKVELFTEAWEQAPDGVTVHRVLARGSRASRPIRFASAVQSMLAGKDFDCVFSLERTLCQDVYRAGDGVHRVWLKRRRQFAPLWKRPFIGLGAFHRNMMRLESGTFDPKNTARIIVNSEMVKREITEHFGFPVERIHLVRNGIDLARIQRGQRAESRKRFGINDNDLVLLFVGSGWERKGLSFILKALARIALESDSATASSGGKFRKSSNIKLLVVGKGNRPLRPPANCIFAGPLADVENAYAAADLFVFLPIYDPSANVCFEALAAGLPVITSAYNGASELIQESMNGTIIANPSDSNAVVQAIEYWRARLNQPRPAADMSALSLERNLAETVAILELAASEKPK